MQIGGLTFFDLVKATVVAIVFALIFVILNIGLKIDSGTVGLISGVTAGLFIGVMYSKRGKNQTK